MRIVLIIIFGLYTQIATAQMEIEPKVMDPAFGQKIEGYLSHTVDLIDVDELNNNYDQYIIIDVRKKEEYNTSHLKNALWLSPKTVLKNHPAYSKEKPIVLYCSVGARSEDMGEQFKALGYEVYNLYGGIFEWVNRDCPVYLEEDNQMKESSTIHTFNFMFRPYVTNKKYKKVGLLNW